MWFRRTSWENNPKTRRGNRWKESFGKYEYDISPSDDVLFANTALAKFFTPEEGAALADFHDHNLIAAGHRLVALRVEFADAMHRKNVDIIKTNAQVDKDIKQLIDEWEKARKVRKDKLLDMEKDLIKGERDAPKPVAAIGGFFDVSKALLESIPQEEKLSEEIVAAKIKLPWTASEKTLVLKPLVVGFITVAFGAALGISWGLSGHKLDATNLTGDPVALTLFCGLGIAFAIPTSYSIWASFREVSERYWLGLARSTWLPLLVLAVSLAIFYCLVDCVIQQYGLLADQKLSESVGRAIGSQMGNADDGVNPIGAFISGLMVSPPMVATHAWLGSFAGRQAACLNQIHLAQHNELELRKQKWEARQEVKKALDAVANVAVLTQQLERERELLAKEEKAFDDRIALIEKKRQDLCEDLTDDQKLLLDNRYFDWVGAQKDFNAMLDVALRKREARQQPSQPLPPNLRLNFNWLQGGAVLSAFVLGLFLLMGSLWALGL